MTTSKLADPVYTFEEFTEHADKVTALLAEDRTAGEGSFERSVLRSSEFFKTHYPEGYERMYKHGRFCLIMLYISNHLNDFDRGDYAVYGSERVGSLVGYHLLRAIHHVYTSDDLLDRQKDPSPEEIMALADQLRESDGDADEITHNPK